MIYDQHHVYKNHPAHGETWLHARVCHATMPTCMNAYRPLEFQITFIILNLCLAVNLTNQPTLRFHTFSLMLPFFPWHPIHEILFFFLQLSVNPDMKVGEQTFENNAASCEMIYSSTSAWIGNCSLSRPADDRGVTKPTKNLDYINKLY